MNGRSLRPRDKNKQNKTSRQDNELILNGIAIKQEPIVKLEPENVVNMVTMPALARAASESIVNSIGGDQNGGTYDFTDVCDLDEAKSEVKKDKVNKEAEKGSAEVSGKRAIEPSSSNDPMDYRANKQRNQSKRGPYGNKNVTKTAAIAKNKSNGNTRNNKKKSAVSKKGKQHKCSSCDYTTSKNYHLNQHIRKHTGEKPFPCTHCAKRFTQMSNLQSHMRTHNSEFSFSCSNCLKGFSQSAEKLEHETNCKIRRFNCHLCKEFSTFGKAHLQGHMRVHHTGEKPFGCDQCSKKFKTQFEVKQHMKAHINPRPLKFKCSVCYRNFSQRIGRDEHEAKCKRRGYECYVCKEYSCHDVIKMKHHMRTHTGIRPFQCKVCQTYFTRKDNLQQHVSSRHNQK